MNNRFMGLTGIVQKAGQSFPDSDILVVDYEERRERHGCYDRKQVTYPRRSSRYSQSINKDGETTHYLWGIRGAFSRHPLQSESRSFEQLSCQNQGTGRRQKIKPAFGCWQGTIENLVAISLFLPRSQTFRNRPRDSLPVSSIANSKEFCKLHREQG
jgi:hypothetical protein